MGTNIKRETCGTCGGPMGSGDWYYCKTCRKNKKDVRGPKIYTSCTKCGGVDKTPTDTWCRQCRASWNREHPRPYRPNPEGSRRRYLKRLYGITPNEYAAKLEQQGGICAICGAEPELRNLDVDHNHQTGQNRSLLCNGCNQALGLFSESPHLLEVAASYLRGWNQ